MGRWVRERGPWFLVAVVFVALLGAAWVVRSYMLPGVVASRLSEALGVRVRVDDAAPTFFPLRLLASGVRLGPDDPAAASAARVYIEVNPAAWLGGRVDDLRIEVWGPRVSVERNARDLLPEVLMRLGAMDPEAAPRVESLLFDELRVERDGAPPLSVSGFRVTDVAFAEAGTSGVSLGGELAVGTSTGRLVVDVGTSGPAPTVLVGAELDDVSLAVLARDPRARVAGRASGRIWYERDWAPQASETLVGGDLVVEDLAVESPDGDRLTARRLALDGVRIAPARYEAELAALDADTVEFPDSTGGLAGWRLRVKAARVADARWADPWIDPPLVLDLLVASDVDIEEGLGSVEVDGSIGEGTVRVVAERDAGPGRFEVQVESVPLPALFARSLGDVAVVHGALDADLLLEGPPGLSGSGVVEVTALETIVRDIGPEAVPLLKVARARLDAEHLSVSPLRVRLRHGVIEEPEIWLRWDEDGLAAERAFAAPLAASASPLVWLQRALLDSFGDSPFPRRISPPAGLRFRDGEVHVVDASVTPTFRLRLRRANAVVHGPAGTDGPLHLRAEARGALRSRYSLYGDSSTRGVSAWFSVAGARLRDFDAYLQHWTGYVANEGRVEIGARARLRPDPAAEVSVSFRAVELAQRGEDGEVERLLGAPLPAIVRRLEGEDGQGALRLELRGREGEPVYGFAAAFPTAFRRAVDAALLPEASGGSENGGAKIP